MDGQPTKEELLAARDVDTARLTFAGLRGDRSRHLSRSALEAGIEALPAAPRDAGTVDLLVARGVDGSRSCPEVVELTVDGGMPGDRWVDEPRYDERYQLATARTDVARLIANGQPLSLHGDNLFLSLDLSAHNLPIGSELMLGEARVAVTPKAHNGCKKWVQRFGLAAMQLNMAPPMAPMNLRGIYLKVLAAGTVRVGDAVRVLRRA